MQKDTIRLDHFLFRTRFFKSKSLATQFCQTGAVHINHQKTTKAHAKIGLGSILSFSFHDLIVILRVKTLPQARIPAKDKHLYFDIIGGEVQLNGSEIKERIEA